MTTIMVRDHRPTWKHRTWIGANNYQTHDDKVSDSSASLYDMSVGHDIDYWVRWLRGDKVKSPRIDRRTMSWHVLPNGLRRVVVCEWQYRAMWTQPSDVLQRWHVDSVSLWGCWRALCDKGVVAKRYHDDWHAYRALVVCGRVD